MQPRLVLMCGLPGAGKTTEARKIEADPGAVRFCGDEWMADLGLDYYDELRHRLWPRLERLWKQVLTGGLSVIVEDGTWQRSERDDLREFAARSGAITEMHCFDVPFDELWRRLEARNAAAPYGTAPISHEVLTDCWNTRFQRPDVAELELFDRLVVHSFRSTRRRGILARLACTATPVPTVASSAPTDFVAASGGLILSACCYSWSSG